MGPVVGALAINLLYNILTSQREFLYLLEDRIPEEIYERLTWSPEYWPFVLGTLFVGVVLLLPGGLWSVPERLIFLIKRLVSLILRTERV